MKLRIFKYLLLGFVFSIFTQSIVYANDNSKDNKPNFSEPLGLYNKVYEANYAGEIEQQETNNVNENTDVYKIKPYEEVTKTENENFVLNQKNIYFENGDFYWFRRYAFKKTTPNARNYSAITIPGNTIEVRYVDPVTKQWVLTGDLNKLKNVKNTLFINTEKVSAILSVPAVYKNLFTNNTLEISKNDEHPFSITHSNGVYTITFSFPQDSTKIGEIWCLQSKNILVDWKKTENYNYLKVHDLAIERRWSWDGYYFKTPSNYVPAGENVLYRHSANYTGASFAKYGSCLASLDLGFIMTKTCLANQNAEGFWATGPMSQWLKADFEIGANFYDTRFSTDFAINLINAYERYKYEPFLEGAKKYAEYFINHANKNHYEVSDGWLVEDYAPNSSQEAHKRTHVSLNHQVNEINFLYLMYNVTKDTKYYNLADKMLKGIEHTKYQWVLNDGNLNYALYYNGTNNVMVDYPYLTYNDLFELKEILKNYGLQNVTINYLMDCKKGYMDRKGITEYRKD